jgi:glycosyltransferase involved in cell wall biosynthesis
MRVAQIIDSLHFGGAQKMQVMLAQAVREHDVDLTVMSLRKKTKDTNTLDELQSLGARVIFYSSEGVLNPKRIWHMARFLRREGIDVVHTHLTYANIVGTLAGRLAGIPVIASLRNSRLEKRFYHPVRYRLETWLLRHWADQVMAVGYATAQAHQERLCSKPIEAVPSAMTLIPPLPEAERAALRTEITGDPSRPLLLAVGRLTYQKGYGYLLTAFADLHQKHPEAALAIAGDGKLYDELMAQIKTLGLEGHAVLLGGRNDVPRLLAASDIFVLSSLWEGLPVAVLEAMAAGVPVVATSVSDTPRVVVDGTGLLVPSQDPGQLSQALCSLLDNPALRQSLGMAAQAHIIQNHNPAVWVKQILAMYEAVQKEPNKKKIAVT